jgi:putative endonuclease
MFYIYILYSAAADKYYVGYTTDVEARIMSHNHQDHFNTFTSKYRPWILKAAFECGNDRSFAMKIEKFIKKQKSRLFIEQLLDENFIPRGILAQLVRVPKLRD